MLFRGVREGSGDVVDCLAAIAEKGMPTGDKLALIDRLSLFDILGMLSYDCLDSITRVANKVSDDRQCIEILRICPDLNSSFFNDE